MNKYLKSAFLFIGSILLCLLIMLLIRNSVAFESGSIDRTLILASIWVNILLSSYIIVTLKTKDNPIK